MAEKIFDKNGKQLDGSYRRIVADKIKREVCDRNSKTLVDTFKLYESPMYPIDIYDKKGNTILNYIISISNKLDDKYINQKSFIPSEELFDKKK